MDSQTTLIVPVLGAGRVWKSALTRELEDGAQQKLWVQTILAPTSPRDSGLHVTLRVGLPAPSPS